MFGPIKMRTADKGLIKALSDICGETHVSVDAVSKDIYASDVYEKGIEPAVIIRPQTTDQICAIVKFCDAKKRPIYIRGGGMSYSNTFLPNRKGAVMLDMQELTTIREINAEDLYVTVEAGCTWAVLDKALEPLGLRAVFWGPFSGRKATIGGSMSQGTANNNSAKIGTSSSTVLSYEIVTGKGNVLNTGADAQEYHKPFFQNYGIDLTGLFSADAGALGIKTAVTLRLEPRPKSYGGVSFAFESFDKMFAAIKAGAASGIASAIIGMDSETAAIRSGETGFMADLKRLRDIVTTAHNPLRGVGRGVKVALAGRRVFERARFTAHFLVEGASDTLMVAKERHLRRIGNLHGDEIPNAAISLMRADNFPDLPVTRYDGLRMLLIHGIFSVSKLEDYAAEYWKIIERYKDDFEKTGIVVADIFTAIGTNGILFEPVFYWPDNLTAYHAHMSPKAVSETWENHPDNPSARDVISKVTTEIIDFMYAHGAVHLQIGKLYPFMRGRAFENAALLMSLKQNLDPNNVINPGALGLKP